MNLLDVVAKAGGWSIGAIWLPMLVWTAVALPIFVVLHVACRTSPHVRYRAYAALLVALPVGLIGAALVSFAGAFFAEGTFALHVPVVMLPEATLPVDAVSEHAGISWTFLHTAGAAFFAAVFMAVWKVLQLARGLLYLRRYRVSIHDLTPAWVRQSSEALGRRLGLKHDVTVVVTDAESSPLTFGWRRPIVVLPEQLAATPEDLELALTHELIHVRRRDYLLQWIEQLVGAAFVIHPLVTLFRREMASLREVTCDADVLYRTGERSRYARLLFRYAVPESDEWNPAIGIQLRQRQLKRRIAAMKDVFDVGRIDRSKRVAVVVGIGTVVLAITAVACTDLLVDSTPGETASAAAVEDGAAERASDQETFVVVEQMPELIGGLASIAENLQYPEFARQAGVEGRVFVQFVVDVEGNVVDPVVTRGLGGGLNEAALEAVRQARFIPGHQHGEPVAVRMSLPVTFRLSPESPPQTLEETGTETSDGSPAREGAPLPAHPTVLVQIDESGSVYVADRLVTLEQVGNALAASIVSSGEQAIVSLRVASNAPMGVVADVQREMRTYRTENPLATDRSPVLLRTPE